MFLTWYFLLRHCKPKWIGQAFKICRYYVFFGKLWLFRAYFGYDWKSMGDLCLPILSSSSIPFYNDICEKFIISMNFGDWIHLITHCSMIWWFIVHLGIVLDWYQNISKVFKLIKNVLWTTLGRRSILDVLCFSVS